MGEGCCCKRTASKNTCCIKSYLNGLANNWKVLCTCGFKQFYMSVGSYLSNCTQIWPRPSIFCYVCSHDIAFISSLAVEPGNPMSLLHILVLVKFYLFSLVSFLLWIQSGTIHLYNNCWCSQGSKHAIGHLYCYRYDPTTPVAGKCHPWLIWLGLQNKPPICLAQLYTNPALS